MKYMVSDNIIQFNKINRFSLRESAKVLKVNHVIISEFVNKKRCTARINIICQIAEAMNVELDDLLFKNIYQS